MAGSSKLDQLNQIRESIKNVVDGLGKPIDDGIFETVVLFNAFGLRTTQSCEGHPDEHGLPFPWVDVSPEEPDDKEWWNDGPLRAGVVEEERRLYGLAVELLSEFYAERKTPYDVMLGFSRFGYGFRIQSIGAEAMGLLNETERQRKFELYSKEMRVFTEFLKGKYLE